MSEVTIIGNGPSRKGFDILGCNHEVWGCNGIYRDTTDCDMVFAVDIEMQQELVESGYYRTNMVAMADIDPIPIEMLEVFTSSMPNVVMTRKEDDTHFIVQGDDDQTDILGLIRPELIVAYQYPHLKNLFCGLQALGFAIENDYETINLIGFDALQGEDTSNIYEGTPSYLTKYKTENAVGYVQRSQFIALLEWYYGKGSVYWKNSLDERVEVKYNELSYYEISEEWILGQGLKSEI